MKGELTHWTVAVLSGKGEATPTTGDKTKNNTGVVKIGQYEIQPVTRAPDPRKEKNTDSYDIRRLLSPRDEAIDLNLDAYEVALRNTQNARVLDPARSQSRKSPEDIDEPNGPAIRHIRGLGNKESNIAAHPERGLLLIYPIDSAVLTESATTVTPTGADKIKTPVIAIGISFPVSEQSATVAYKVNNTYWEQEMGESNLS